MIAAWKFQVAALLLLIQPKGDVEVLPADTVLIVARATGQCGDKGAERRAGRIGEIAPELARGICEAAGCVAGVDQQPRRLASARPQDKPPRADTVEGAGPATDPLDSKRVGG